jgi:2-polyprenyl-6-methoxyphenol hydroxylase-like FAD-dependent oxidoreductase
MLLAKQGYRVLLLDKAGFPSDTLSTHYLHQPGGALLKRWGLLDQVIASNCPPIRCNRVDLGPIVLRGSAPPMDGMADGYAPRRRVLDNILVKAAVAAGAELREHFSAQELVMDGDRVTGIRGHAVGGAMVTEESQIVIGADGLRSLVARSVQAPTYNAHPALTCAYYTYWSDVPVEDVELYARPNHMLIAAPTNDGQTLTISYWPIADFHQVRDDIEGSYWRALELAPGLAQRLRAGRQAERFYGTADLPNFFRQPHGPGWALVGDAGYHKDPILAQGISDAFRDAALLAAAVDAGLSGRRPLEAALADYQRERDQQVMPIFESTLQFASLQPPPPEQFPLFAALQGNQPQIDRFIGTFAGTVPISEFFAPENIGQIMSMAAPVSYRSPAQD